MNYTWLTVFTVLFLVQQNLNCQIRLTSILRLGGSSGEVVSCRLELDPTTKFTQVIL